MSEKLEQAMLEMRKINYVEVYEDGQEHVVSERNHDLPQHERQVLDALEKHGFIQYHKEHLSEDQKKKAERNAAVKKLIYENDNSEVASLYPVEPGTFVHQPCGTCRAPDVLIRDLDGRYLAIECKGGIKKNQNPTYNDSLPGRNTILIFTNDGEDRDTQTTFFLGRDIVDEKTRATFIAHNNMNRSVDEGFKGICDTAENECGFCPSSRPRICQMGPGEKTNPFRSAKRAQREQNVLDFARNEIPKPQVLESEQPVQI